MFDFPIDIVACVFEFDGEESAPENKLEATTVDLKLIFIYL